MSTVEFPEGSFDGVVAFSGLFICLATVRSACSDRYFLGSNWVVYLLGPSRSLKSDEEFQFEKDWFGASMYWSSFDAEIYRKLIVESGFVIELEVVETSDDPNSETEKEIHLWMVDRRPE